MLVTGRSVSGGVWWNRGITKSDMMTLSALAFMIDVNKLNPISIAMETYSFGRLAFEAEHFRPVKLNVGNK